MLHHREYYPVIQRELSVTSAAPLTIRLLAGCYIVLETSSESNWSAQGPLWVFFRLQKFWDEFSLHSRGQGELALRCSVKGTDPNCALLLAQGEPEILILDSPCPKQVSGAPLVLPASHRCPRALKIHILATWCSQPQEHTSHTFSLSG